jgi:methionyl-tRNA formyltransferase
LNSYTKTNLRIIYLGTPEFAVAGLEYIVKDGWNVVAVVTAPDKPSGRGLNLTESPVKSKAVSLGIPVLQPSNLKDSDFLDALKQYKADLQIVVAFRMLPEAVWKMPPLGTFNLHASLLPQYRGAAPINWAIMNGEKITGVTTFFLKHEIDTGDIILKESIAIQDEDDLGSMYQKLMKLGAETILKSLYTIISGNFKPIPQENWTEKLLPAPKIFKETCQINWENTAEEIHNFVRGLSPFPAAWTEINNKKYKIYKTKPSQQTQELFIVSDQKTFIRIKTKNGSIEILELQPEGKKRMEVKEFLRGNKIDS